MTPLARPQTIAVAALGGLILLCAAVVGFALQIRSEAHGDLAETRAAFARFSALPGGRAGPAVQAGRAPARRSSTLRRRGRRARSSRPIWRGLPRRRVPP